MENAIIIRQLDVIKTYVDFSDTNNICDAIDASAVSTIHTNKTQELSSLLGVHLMGFVDRDGSDINNKKACEISGYDYLGSFMLLCKTDDKFNALPFSEAELETVFNYLVTGEIVQKHKGELYNEFCERYGVNPILPSLPVKPKFFARSGVPYVVIARYNFDEAKGNEFNEIGVNLFHYSTLLLEKFKNVSDVYLSNDGKYYLKCYKDSNSGFYYVLIQAKDVEGVDEIFIKDPESIVKAMFTDEKDAKENLEDALEEVVEFDHD